MVKRVWNFVGITEGITEKLTIEQQRYYVPPNVHILHNGICEEPEVQTTGSVPFGGPLHL